MPRHHPKQTRRHLDGSRLRLTALGVTLALTALVLSGCSLFYRTNRAGTRFTLYADRSDEFVNVTASRVEMMFASFASLFEIELDSLGSTVIFLEGENDSVVDHQYSPDLLGYYVPFLQMIRIDTRAAMTSQKDGLEQVLLHEIAHHFIAHEHPRATEECWLNEGLAGALEVSVLADGRAEYALLNPVLLGIARRAALERRPEEWIEAVVNTDWEGFHKTDHREEHYAIAWSIVYFLLTESLPQDQTLGRRFEMLYAMDRTQIRQQAIAWHEFTLKRDPVDALTTLAKSRDPDGQLTARWAIRQLAAVKGLQSARALEALHTFLEDDDETKAELASVSFLGLLARVPHVAFFAADSTALGLDRVRGLIANPSAPASLRTHLVESISAPHVTHDAWFPVLVDALETRQPRLRAAAARTLSRLGAKPTITNPAFWHHASLNDRRHEVREWRRWLEKRDSP